MFVGCPAKDKIIKPIGLYLYEDSKQQIREGKKDTPEVLHPFSLKVMCVLLKIDGVCDVTLQLLV